MEEEDHLGGEVRKKKTVRGKKREAKIGGGKKIKRREVLG